MRWSRCPAAARSARGRSTCTCKGLEALGAELDLRDGYVHATAPNGLKGAVFEFPFVSVGATENLLMAATLARGTTVLKNAAREPEIVDLAHCLRRMGAQIEGEGTETIEVQGVERLRGATHPVVADRIELGTYMLAPAITGGEVELVGGRRELVAAFADKLEEAGIEVGATNAGLKVARANGRIRAVDVETAPFPGFPTDLQAQMMALLTLADGVSHLEERIFENRFMHAPELARMGAQIEVHGGTATVTGVEKLKGAPVMATDLRASVSLILAGLAAEGETRVARVYHLDRGYERVEEKLSACGAEIERVTRHDRGRPLRGRRRAARSGCAPRRPRTSRWSRRCCRTRWRRPRRSPGRARHRRFSLLVNRFRWEDAPAAERQGRPFERVQALLAVDGRAERARERRRPAGPRPGAVAARASASSRAATAPARCG